MTSITLKPRAEKFIKSLPLKHQRQIKERIISLRDNHFPHDVKKLVGYENYVRLDAGEYRIIYRYDSAEDLITVVLIGKRNDGEVYKEMKRIL